MRSQFGDVLSRRPAWPHIYYVLPLPFTLSDLSASSVQISGALALALHFADDVVSGLLPCDAILSAWDRYGMEEGIHVDNDSFVSFLCFLLFISSCNQ